MAVSSCARYVSKDLGTAPGKGAVLLIAWRCLGIRKQLALLAGDDLPDSEKSRVWAHLNSCPRCHEHMAALRRAREAMLCSEAGDAQESPSLWPSLRSQLNERVQRRRALEPAQRSWLPIAALAA